MKDLVIVESPSKSKTIGKYLGENYQVVSSKGHIADLAISGKDGLGVDIENNFQPKYTINKDKKDTVKELKKYAKQADHIYLATDPDREGEAISWHLARELGLDLDQDNRIEFHEVTKNAVNNALLHPRKIDMDLVKSQETRRILDRIIGFKLSKLLQNKIKSKSAGRVQSVALKLIVDREKEIDAFVSEEYWDIKANFTKDNIEFESTLTKYQDQKVELSNQQEVDAILSALSSDYTVVKKEEKKRKREPRLAYITSTLQQDASTKLHFSSKKTMTIAQRLYEGVEIAGNLQGLITYMRTDSSRLAPEFVGSAMNYIETTYGKNYVGYYRSSKDALAQDAHEAIRPTNISNTPESVKPYLSNDDYKLYKMIYVRALSSLMAASQYQATSIILDNNGYQFNANGSVLVFDGYLIIANEYESSKDTLLPLLNEQDVLQASDVKGYQHFTQPPNRYSEAGLIKKMEEEGIGRPSTYATIIDTIQARGYVTLASDSETSKTKVFKPTQQGELTTVQLEKFFDSIINVSYTADMEKQLDEIAEGQLDNVESLQRFYNEFAPLVDNAYENMEKKAPEKVGRLCPQCGNELVYRMSRYGKFISCSNFPGCTYSEKIVDPNKYVPQPSGKTCPKCGNELLRRKSRYNTFFLGCSNYPKCHYMETEDGQEIISKKDRASSKSTTKTKTTKKTTAKKSTAKKATKRTIKKSSGE